MLYSVQFLRFVAAAMIVVTHSFNVLGIPKSTPIGDVGVDIFFVISGIVIGVVLEKGPAAGEFAVKRLIRIFPIYWIALASLAIFEFAHWHVLPGWRRMVFSTFLIPGTDYILFPAWTLTYEMFFYLVVSISLLVNARRAKWTATAGIAAFALAPIPYSIFQPHLCLEFLLGFWLPRSAQKRRTFWPFLLMIGAAVALYLATPLRLDRALKWGIPSALLLYGALQLDWLPFFHRPSVLFEGDASYSIYLFHIPLMIMMEQGAPQIGISLDHHVWATVPLAVLAIALSLGLHAAIERPLLSVLRRRLTPATCRPSTCRATRPGRRR